MASIVDELRKKIKEQGGDASDVHTIKQGIKRLDIDGNDESLIQVSYDSTNEIVKFTTKKG